MLGLTLLVASIAIADSINPSTVIPALWLAGGSSSGRLASYTRGVFLVYLAGGIVLLFGPGQVAIGALHHIQGSLEHILGIRARCGDHGDRASDCVHVPRGDFGDSRRAPSGSAAAGAALLAVGLNGLFVA